MTQQDTSIVGVCEAQDCRFNQERRCHAGQIEVSFSGTQAACMTYSPSGDAQGTGEQPQQRQ
ncbi:DUF1540 domain-containing protein [Deinococcus maricopensis]|uniref:DUF1540 domain-containing protein n=1 Tax=Deinococcus maricopensis (strain DSM 21211 / LMG 22137 / NRRL B-23946 / LB-34) TaxID=709986 RepID=E8UAJ7_DEIML|nr:DUF1540 domain-containing protein [Deinococcus maricopensis]ADV68086.1 protein of unknown function DUF1540 [Deinococcus maricopensis DSM 21211]